MLAGCGGDWRDPLPVDETVRRHFIEQLRALAALGGLPEEERVLAAFAAVPREAFAGPGPWSVLTPLHLSAPVQTPDADPRHLYHAVLISLDRGAGINIGAPTLWARLLSRFAVPDGHRVCQVGAGSGYYTAILAELVGASGHVTAYETEPHLVALAEAALADRPNVTLLHDNATGLVGASGPFDAIIAFAGVTHPPRPWCEALAPDGRMLLPLTGGQGFGAMAEFKRADHGPAAFTVSTLGSVGFYPCHGARDPFSEHALDTLFADRTKLDGATLHGQWEGDRFLYEA